MHAVCDWFLKRNNVKHGLKLAAAPAQGKTQSQKHMHVTDKFVVLQAVHVE